MIPALSIRQPWAHRIFAEGKDVENRGWVTAYRGPLLIHAGVRPDPDEECPPGLPLGGVVGLVDLVDIVDDSPSPWFCGPYGWVIARPRALAFTPLRGKVGLFYPPLPAALQEALAALT